MHLPVTGKCKGLSLRGPSLEGKLCICGGSGAPPPFADLVRCLVFLSPSRWLSLGRSPGDMLVAGPVSGASGCWVAAGSAPFGAQ